MYALQCVSHWQKPRDNANAAPPLAVAEAVGMGERDFWYWGESRHEHSSLGQRLECWPRTVLFNVGAMTSLESKALLLWAPFVLSCEDFHMSLALTVLQLSAERGNIFTLRD